jgi:isopenicillin N synthase-like dioxygenase
MSDDKTRGIDATNRDFLRHDQVVKRQRYRLAEAEGEEAFDDAYAVRTCDMRLLREGTAAGRRDFAAGLGDALRDIGFAVLENTGLDPGLDERTERNVRRLFCEPSLETKLRFRARRHGSVNQGYFPLKETSHIHPDLVEGWVFCRRAFDLGEEACYNPARFWPLPRLEPEFRDHCLRHLALVPPLVRSMLEYLGVDPHAFDARLDPASFGLRLNYYPPVTGSDAASGAARLLGHEDVDLFTLVPAPRVEGLQVLHRATMKWVRLHPPAGTIVLNTGDYMQRITNDLFPSTTHRVSPPRDPAQRAADRVSFPLNIYLREDDVLEVLPGLGPPKYEPVRAVEFHTRITSKYYGDEYAADV